MDRYGYVSNNYYGHAMGGQARAIAGNGGCCPSTKYQYRQTQMPVTQPPFGCNYRGNGQPVVMTQPMPDPRMMIFSQEGREWTTGICGCFEHCSSCMAAFCCMPCFACFLANHMNENMCGPLGGSAFCIALRTRLRGINGIEGSVCEDMCSYWCCPCCTLAQMYREIKNTME